MDRNDYKSKNQLIAELREAKLTISLRMQEVRQLDQEVRHLSAELDNAIKVAKKYEEAMLAQQDKIKDLESKLVDHSGLFAPIGEEVEEESERLLR